MTDKLHENRPLAPWRHLEAEANRDDPRHVAERAWMAALVHLLSGQPGDTRAMTRLRAWSSDLFGDGRGVPARDMAPNAPFVTFIAEKMQIQQSVLSAPKHKRFLEELGDLIGFDIVHRSRSNEFVSLEELVLLAPAPLFWALPDADPKSIAQSMSELSAAARACGEAANAAALPALHRLLGAAVVAQKAKEAIRYITERFAEDGLPLDGRERLRIMLSRRGMSVAELSREIDGDFSSLKEKIAGRRRLTSRDLEWLRRAETALRLTEGSLTDTLKAAQRGIGNPIGAFPADLPPLDDRERSKVALFLPPEFAQLSDEERRQHVEQALMMISNSVTAEKAAAVRLRADAYALHGDLPSIIDRELQSFEKFYGGAMAPTGMVSDRARWSPGSIQIRAGFAKLFGGWLAHDSRDAAAVAPDAVTLGFLIEPEVLETFFLFRMSRRIAAYASIGVDVKAIFTEEYISILEFAAVLFHPDNGWATQSKTLQGRLRPIARHAGEYENVDPDATLTDDADWLLSPAAVAKATGRDATAAIADASSATDAAFNEDAWRTACTSAYQAYRRMIKNQRRKVETSRDSHVPIVAILRDPNPMRASRMAIEGLRGELLRLDPDTKAYASVLRDLVTLRIVSQAGFRRRTIIALDYVDPSAKSGQKGKPVLGVSHLQKDGDGVWWLRVPRQLFKNPTSAYFIDGEDQAGHSIYRDYEEPLEDIDGFYAELELYLTTYRAILLGKRTGRALLIGSRDDEDGRLTHGALDQMSRRIWNRHILWNPLRRVGFEGVFTTCGWHAWRHCLATAVLKFSGSFTMAADAIQDSVDVARMTYTRYVSSDRSKEYRVLRRGLMLMPSDAHLVGDNLSTEGIARAHTTRTIVRTL